MNWRVVGGVTLFLAVLLGAFGAHALKVSLPDQAMDWWGTASDYHFWHGLGIVAVSLVRERQTRRRLLSLSGWFFLSGLVLFCGSLYVMAVTDARWLGMITPLGGLAFMLGWLCFAWSVSAPRVIDRAN